MAEAASAQRRRLRRARDRRLKDGRALPLSLHQTTTNQYNNQPIAKVNPT